MERIDINKQSSIRIENGAVVYVDPWEVPAHEGDADIIFVTHDHFDHFSPEDIEKLKNDATVLVVPEGMKRAALRKTSVKEANCLAVKPGKTYVADGISFETVASYNRTKHFHPIGSGFCGYIVTLGDERYFITGDTDDTPEMRRAHCDVLLLPVGGTYTMNVEEAAELAAAIAPKVAIPTHYGSVVGKSGDGEAFREKLKALNPDVETLLLL